MHGRVSFPVVGLGGSAGGLQALIRFFEHLPADTGMAYVVILHLSPHHESNAAQILQRATAMPVGQVTATVTIETDHVYVIPPHSDLQMHDGSLQVACAVRPVGSAVTIDLFFKTLANVQKELAFCVVLSGTGSDGAIGLSAVKGEGGVTFAQAPEDAQWSDMPRAAIATGLVDIVLPVAQIGPRLVELARDAGRLGRLVAHDVHDESSTVTSLPSQSEPALHDILAMLRLHTRHDFRHYKLGTVLRRIRRRLQLNGLTSLESYRDFLRAEPAEVRPLLQDLLISVTGFFRNPEAFSALKERVLPELLDGLAPGEALRLWSAGCATGEEPYTLGMLVQEVQELQDSANGTLPAPFQIFASDIDERAVQTARRGVYRSGIQADVSPARLERFFVQEDDRFRVTTALRERVLFAAHNLLRDPPFSRVGLICCRNLLIYLDPAAQARTLEMFHYALSPGGHLMLGITESTGAAEHLFTCVDPKNRIFRAMPGRSSRARLLPVIAQAPRVEPAMTAAASGWAPIASVPSRDAAARAHLNAIGQVAAASVLIDERHGVLHLSATAGRFMSHAGGPPSSSLLDNVDTDLRLGLRTALFEAARSGAHVRVRAVRTTPVSGPLTVDIVVHPLPPKNDARARILVVFEEIFDAGTAPVASAAPAVDDADSGARALLRQAHEEIERLKGVLHETLEHSVQATEELGSANEELQAINEELRSAGEELETSKEELFSMNEELMTVNAELRAKVEERGRLNDDLQNFTASSGIATVFVDAGLRVKRFTPQASTLFNLIASDIGRPLLDITTSFDYAGLSDDAMTVFRLLQPIERRIRATNGRHFLARILPYRTADDTIDGAVLTFVDITQLQHAEERVRSSEERLRTVAASTQDYAILAMDDRGLVTAWNAGAERVFGYAEAEMLGQAFDAIFTLEDRVAGVPAQELAGARDTGRAEDERWHRRKDGSTFYCSGVLMQLQGRDGAEFAKIARDITGSKRHALAQENLLLRARQDHSEARQANETKDRFLAVMSHELKQPLNLIHVQAELLTRLPETRSLAPVQRAAATIQRAVGSQSRIIDDLLDLSRVRTGKLRLDPQAVELEELVRGLAEAASEEVARKGLVLEVACESGVRCVCDRVRVEQIVSNLLANAVKFTPQGGRVRLELAKEGRNARLSIADTGTGIAPQALSQIFEMFSQIDPRSIPGNTGLGIGLTLVRELVKAHRGSVEATSGGAGRGSCFTVRLPLTEDDDGID
ncbi:MAG: CheR family methyltransferase [Janthinobacterium lividum]